MNALLDPLRDGVSRCGGDLAAEKRLGILDQNACRLACVIIVQDLSARWSGSAPADSRCLECQGVGPTRMSVHSSQEDGIVRCSFVEGFFRRPLFAAPIAGVPVAAGDPFAGLEPSGHAANLSGDIRLALRLTQL